MRAVTTSLLHERRQTMKIVIDIPEDDYEFIKDLNAVMGGRVSCKTIQYNVINAIKNGTPVKTGEWEKVTEAHEDIGYDRGFRDGYAQCITEHVLIQKELADCGFVASAVLKGEKENT